MVARSTTAPDFIRRVAYPHNKIVEIESRGAAGNSA